MTSEQGNARSNMGGRAAEFFAGIGLVRMAIEHAGWTVEYANDISPIKRAMYRENFKDGDFDSRDIREVRGVDVPDVDMATASFPCVDLSLAGKRSGLNGEHSSLFWEFSRVIEEMAERRPQFVLIENVPSFINSRGGKDLREALERLNGLGYQCDLLLADAKWHVPQSRLRFFVVGRRNGFISESADPTDSPLRPSTITKFVERNPGMGIRANLIPHPKKCSTSLAEIVERIDEADGRWWDSRRMQRFTSELSVRNLQRLKSMKRSRKDSWATAYRRTRNGRSVWEIRSDQIAGCLRTTGGGSSKQALVQASNGRAMARWMTPVEYARLQGAGDYKIPESVSVNQALFGFGDAVCVPVVEWLVKSCVRPDPAKFRGY